MTITAKTIEGLNEAAQSVWDTAYAKGHRAGVEEERDELARHHATSMLEFAAKLLDGALGDDPERMSEEERRRQALLARLALGRTPLLASGQTQRAITATDKAIGRAGSDDPLDRDALGEAIRAVASALTTLEEDRS